MAIVAASRLSCTPQATNQSRQSEFKRLVGKPFAASLRHRSGECRSHVGFKDIQMCRIGQFPARTPAHIRSEVGYALEMNRVAITGTKPLCCMKTLR